MYQSPVIVDDFYPDPLEDGRLIQLMGFQAERAA